MNCSRVSFSGDVQRGFPHGGALRRTSAVGSCIAKARRALTVCGCNAIIEKENIKGAETRNEYEYKQQQNKRL